jgi:hypothetical protein
MPNLRDAVTVPRGKGAAVQAGGEEVHQRLDTGLRQLPEWCDSPPSAEEEGARRFDIVVMSLTSWLDWNTASQLRMIFWPFFLTVT